MSLPKILEVVNNKVVINEVILSVPEFKTLIETFDIDTSIMCFQYIWAMYDPNSAYFNLDEMEKEEKILNDYPVQNYLNEFEMIAAIEKAEELYNSPIRKILKGTKNAVEKLVDYFDTMTIEAGRDGNIAAVSSAIINLPKIIKSYQEAEQAYKTEVQRNRGDMKTGVDDDYEPDYD